MRLTDTVMVITGAGSGIGRALALRAATQCRGLALSDVDTRGLDETRALLSSRDVDVSTEVVNVADRAAMHAYADRVVSRHGVVDVVVNNAGVALMETVDAVTYEDLDWIVGVNFWGVVHGTKAFLPHLKQRPKAALVNISSIAGLTGLPVQAAYSATKFAVRGFSEAMRLELAGSPLEVYCVLAGGVRTSIVQNARYYRNPDRMDAPPDQAGAAERFSSKYALTTPEEAAHQIASCVERGKRRIVVGWDARVIDGLSRFFPGFCQTLIAQYARHQGS